MLHEMKLSICVIVYNHAKYIKECLNGIFIQKADFNIEVIISEDCSTDNSRQIIDDFFKDTEVPDNITVIRKYHSANLGMNRNVKYALELASGTYITLIEGDDYWDSPDKLNLQVTFLDENSEFSTVTNETGIVNEYGEFLGQFFTGRKLVEIERKQEFSIADYLKYDCLFHTSSLVYRNLFKGKCLPDLMLTAMSLDQAIFILFTPTDRIWFMTEKMGNYRVHSGGITQSNNHRNLKKVTINQIKMFDALNVFTGFKHNRAISFKLRKLKFERLKIGLGLPGLKRYIKRISQ